LLQCVLEFQSDHAQWRSKGEETSGGMRPGMQALEGHQYTLFKHLKNDFFSRNLGHN